MKYRQAEDSDLDKVCQLLASEFFSDPVLQYAFTNREREQRMKVLRGFFRVYVNLAREYGGILLAENDAGVLVYFKPELMELTAEENDRLDNQLRQECSSDYARIMTLMNGLNQYHPRTLDHYYIFAIAVKRTYRRNRVASGLLEELNIILDRDEVACYSECTMLRTCCLFRRFGYYDAGPPLQIGGFPDLFPVWRNPQKKNLDF